MSIHNCISVVCFYHAKLKADEDNKTQEGHDGPNIAHLNKNTLNDKEKVNYKQKKSLVAIQNQWFLWRSLNAMQFNGEVWLKLAQSFMGSCC